MAIIYKLSKTNDPSDTQQTLTAYIPKPKIIDELVLDDIVKEITQRTHLSNVDIEGIIRALIDQIIYRIQLSTSVELGAMGKMWASIATDQVDSPLNYSKSMIRQARYVYHTSSRMKKAIAKYTLHLDSKASGMQVPNA